MGGEGEYCTDSARGLNRGGGSRTVRRGGGAAGPHIPVRPMQATQASRQQTLPSSREKENNGSSAEGGVEAHFDARPSAVHTGEGGPSELKLRSAHIFNPLSPPPLPPPPPVPVAPLL
eukprot:Hpha_TRINITY_DN11444_c0_g1::TRINITY_DN11444_c0_g1_i1::g.137569::m.137569